MTYQPPTHIQAEPTYKPNEEQLVRAEALRRFNWLYVYTPLIIGTVIVFVLLGFMFWGAFAQPVEDKRLFLSGLADIVIIFTALPMTLLCAVGPVALVGMIAYRVQKQRERKEAGQSPPAGGRLQRLIWRLDAMLDNVYGKIVETLPKITNPVIQFNALLAYVKSLWNQLKKFLMRS